MDMSSNSLQLLYQSGLESRHFIQIYSWYFDLESKYRACRSLFNDDKRKTLTQFGRIYAGLDN
jgi:hypothetical protein